MIHVECRTNGLRKSNEVVFPYPNNNLDQPYVNKLWFLRFRVCDLKSDKKRRDEVVQGKVAKRNSAEIERGLNASAQRETLSCLRRLAINRRSTTFQVAYRQAFSSLFKSSLKPL